MIARGVFLARRQCRAQGGIQLGGRKLQFHGLV